MSFYSVVAIGRVTRGPDHRYAPSGAPVCSFALETSRRDTAEDGRKVESATVLDVTAWRQLAEICQQFLTMGQKVLVMGTLRQTHWVDPKTRQPLTKITVVARQIQFLGGKKPREEGIEQPD